MKQATLVWEWKDAPEELRRMSPAYDDVSYLVILPEGTDPSNIPWWVESLVHPGGGGADWKCWIGQGHPDYAGRILLAVCHA